MKEALRTEGLSKSFGKVKALENINLSVAKGELFGLVGPDGAGKTTLIRILCGLIETDSGNGWVGGCSIIGEQEAIKEKIGYMPQRFGLYEDLTVIENLLFYTDLFDISGVERQRRIDRLLNFSGLLPFKQRLAGKLSGGMKQKLALACSLMHKPMILMLDEPTNGVDPLSRRDFWRILYELLSEGVTIFVSTSYLEEAERCSKIALIHKGSIIINATPKEAKQGFKHKIWKIGLNKPLEATRMLSDNTTIKYIAPYGDCIHISVDSDKEIDPIISNLQDKGIIVDYCKSTYPSIEDLFITAASKDCNH